MWLLFLLQEQECLYEIVLSYWNVTNETLPSVMLNLNLQNPFYRYNDDKWRNIADKNWAYEKTFSVDGSLTRHKEQWLVCEGLDTIANISVNSIPLGTTKNMFIRHVIYILLYFLLFQQGCKAVQKIDRLYD